MVSVMAFFCFEPTARAITTFAPTLHPIKTLTTKLINAVVVPTAPTASGSLESPTMTVSAMLNATCRRLAAMSGRQKRNICGKSAPWSKTKCALFDRFMFIRLSLFQDADALVVVRRAFGKRVVKLDEVV